jgi:sn-glycerol 3-phosphate transport system substrate-binding protein
MYCFLTPTTEENDGEVESARANPMISRRSLLASTLAGIGALSTTGCHQKSEQYQGRTVVDLWFSYGGKNRIVLLELVKRFNDVYQNKVWIRATFQGDYFEALAKLRTALAAGVAPTITHVIGEVVPYLAQAKTLEPLDRFPDAKNLDLIHELSQAGSYSGAEKQPLWSLPFNRSTPIMYINQDWLDRKGIAIPKTWDELQQAAKELTEHQRNSSKWGYEVPISWWFWVALTGQAGGHVVDPNGTISLGGEAGEQAVRFWQTLIHKDRSMRPPAGRDYNAWEVTNQDFISQRAAMIWTSTAFLKYLEENVKFKLVAARLPMKVRHAVPTGGTAFVMMRTAPEATKQAAWTFLKFMCQAEQTITWSTRTGYMPVSQSAVHLLENQGYYKKNPNDRVAIDQLKVAQPWPWSSDLFRIQRDIVTPRLEKAVLRNLDAKKVFDEARQRALLGY